MMIKKAGSWMNLLVAISLILALMTIGMATSPAVAQESDGTQAPANMGTLSTSDAGPQAQASHRLLVELKSPALAEWSKLSGQARGTNGKLNVLDAGAQNYINQLKTEQAAFVAAMQQALPQAKVGTFRNELGQEKALTYQVVINGLAIDPGMDKLTAARILSGLPNVKAVYFDYAHQPDLYASLPLINAPAAWNNATIGGKANAGAGIKVASMDGGVHKDAPMFNGAGYSYPPGYPAGGLGLTANNNGKIIASRVYFRTWDPPSPGDENPWPGTQGTSHGVHTASIAAGNEVVASYLNITTTLSGVAPRAWVMSYRVFYNSITNDGSFYDAEGIAALEDIAKDGADVLNNSWGGGPGSIGGQYDLLDRALINTAASGVFVSMSNGNAGPGLGTGDHPSDAYINVAASTTTGTLASAMNVIAPTPVSTTLQNMPFAIAAFGAPLPEDVYTYTFKSALSVDPTNVMGCGAFPAGSFTGKAALIMRGVCNFSDKVMNAQNAGAVATVVYNDAARGDALVSMSCTPNPPLVNTCNDITIPAVFVGYSKGVAMNNWYATYGDSSKLTIDTKNAYQIGNRPDVVADFSSRGPGVGSVLKPDIIAPGVNILAQGFTPNATGEARHMGWGQASGTSMAAPHVTGAAALLRQIHPDWSNEYIKSALMTTSKYEGIYTNTGAQAQPMDMGAGRLDLTHAADPGVVLQPVSAAFGQVISGTLNTRNIWVTNISGSAETYTLSAVKLSATNFGAPTSAPLAGVSVSPSSLTLAASETAVITVTFNTANGIIGDNQGWVLMDGPTHDAHFPVWARSIGQSTKPVLVIDKDFSNSGVFDDYRAYYTNALTNLGLAYDVSASVPSGTTLARYKTVIFFTGDNYVTSNLSGLEQDALTEFANQGGVILAMGQDLASVTGSAGSNPSFFYSFVLGGKYLQDSVTNPAGALPTKPVVARSDAPPALQNISIDLSGGKTNTVNLTGANEVPPVATTAYGTGKFGYIDPINKLTYDIKVFNPLGATTPLTITAGHIHTGTVGVNGPVLFPLFTGPKVITDTALSVAGSVTLDAAQEAALKSGGLYVNFHSTTNPGGLIRAQVSAFINGDGAGNQYFVDELKSFPGSSPDPNPGVVDPYRPLFVYPGTINEEDGTVTMAHRDQPSLERPGISYLGRSVYTTFGLEGVNNGVAGSITRENLLQDFLNWGMDTPVVTVTQLITGSNASGESMFEATLASNITGVTGVQYRWDFGDGSAFTPFYNSSTVGHTYQYCGYYPVRVEVVDSWGNHTISQATFRANACSSGVWKVMLPLIAK